MKPCYFWATPSGPINLIKAEDMPVMKYWPEGTPMYSDYNAALKRAKESSIPIQDQDIAKRMIMQWLNDQPLGQGMIERDRVHGPFTVEYRIEDACAHDSCPVDGMCEHCKEPVKVAILLPEKEPQEYNIESLRKELEECKQAYSQQLERNAAIAKDLEYWAQRSADLMKELQQLRNQ